MQVHRKSVRDYVEDVRTRPWDPFKGEPLPGPPPQSNVFTYPTITREQMWGKGANQLLDVSVYSIAPGEEDSPHHHPDHIEFVICWRGTGIASIAKKKDETTWHAPVHFQFKRGDSIVVPKGALHRFKADPIHTMDLPNPAFPDVPPTGTPDPNAPKTKLDWPSEKVELVVIHAPNCVRVPYEHAFASPPDPVVPPPDLFAMKRAIGQFSGYARDPRLQCVRARIWGREAEKNLDGTADNAKPLLHFTAYTFVPGQENPEHYHPHSIEFVMCMQGRANMTVRPMVRSLEFDDEPFKAGWEDPYDVAELNEGDIVIVPEGALHWYLNASNEDCVLVALQSPHPILHILEDDADVTPAS